MDNNSNNVNNNIGERIKLVIQYKTNGSKKDFAELCQWSQQYLQNVINKGAGIKPVTEILQAIPELNARWLILGDGQMLTTEINQTKQRILTLLQFEEFLPVMNEEHVLQLAKGDTSFVNDKILRIWRARQKSEQLYAIQEKVAQIARK